MTVLTTANRQFFILYNTTVRMSFCYIPKVHRHDCAAVSLAGHVLYLFADIFIYLSVFSMQSL